MLVMRGVFTLPSRLTLPSRQQFLKLKQCWGGDVPSASGQFSYTSHDVDGVVVLVC